MGQRGGGLCGSMMRMAAQSIWRRILATREVLLTVFVLGSLAVLLSYVSPETIVAWIGVENTYLTVFLIAALGGLSSVTSGVLYASLVIFAAAGALPWLLGLVGGVGIAIGDSLIFLLLRYGYRSAPTQWRERVIGWRTTLDRLPRSLQYLLGYLVLGFSPLPNDIVMLFLVMLGYQYRYVAPLLLLSGITIATLTASLGAAGRTIW